MLHRKHLAKIVLKATYGVAITSAIWFKQWGRRRNKTPIKANALLESNHIIVLYCFFLGLAAVEYE